VQTPPGQGPLRILNMQAMPNPNPHSIAINLAGSADSVELAVYTPSMVKVSATTTGPMEPGWNRIPVASLLQGERGLLFLVAVARRGDVEGGKALVRVLVMR